MHRTTGLSSKSWSDSRRAVGLPDAGRLSGILEAFPREWTRKQRRRRTTRLSNLAAPFSSRAYYGLFDRRLPGSLERRVTRCSGYRRAWMLLDVVTRNKSAVNSRSIQFPVCWNLPRD